MTFLILETGLLLAAAFFIGAALGCGLRKLFTPATAAVTTAPAMTAGAVARAVEPLPNVRDPGTAPKSVDRFERALGGGEPPKPATAAAAPAKPVEPPAEKPAVSVTPAMTAPLLDAAAKVAPTIRPVDTTSPTDPVVPPPPRIDTTPMAAATPQMIEVVTPPGVAPPMAPRAVDVAPPAAPVAPVPTAPAIPMAPVPMAPVPMAPVAQAPVPPAATGPDDLKDIRGIDDATVISLSGLNVRRYADIAAWRPADVARVSADLGFKGRIERENWIEQAQILAAGGMTAYARQRRLGGGPMITTADPVAAPPSAPTSAPAISMPAPPATTSTSAPPAAISTPAPPVAATIAEAAASADVPPASTPTPSPAMPAAAPPVATTAAEPAMPAVATTAAAAAAAAASAAAMARQALSPVEGPKVEERAAFATTAPPPAVAAPLPAATPIRPAISTRDALQRIVGINPEIERLLNVQGVTRYAHIAAWGQPEIDRFDRLLGAPGRVRRENWIEQATMLARGGDTSGAKAATPNAPQPMAAPASTGASMLAAAAPAAMAAMASAPAPAAAPMPAPPMPAPPMPTPAAAAAVSPEMERMPPAAAGGVVPRTDLSALRSVRSDAYQPRGGEPRGALDDLKRIRGIGVLIEKRLNSVGVTSYQQIANWTNDDVARFSQMLDFKGRIERENWIEQARILAAGGYTEFSRRVDKGDVDTSRSRPN